MGYKFIRTFLKENISPQKIIFLVCATNRYSPAQVTKLFLHYMQIGLEIIEEL